MTRIRDLGVNVIPAPIHRPQEPPQIPYWACEECACNNTERGQTSCEISGILQEDPQTIGGFTPDAIAQIRQQLQSRTVEHLVN